MTPSTTGQGNRVSKPTAAGTHPPVPRGPGPKRSSIPGIAVVVALVAGSPATALAQDPAGNNGYSADIEMVRPTFGHGSFHGLDVPMAKRPFTFRYGVVAQYQRDPLTLYNRVDDVEEGAIVTNRGAAALGASLDLSERFTLNLVLPTAFNWGTEITQFAADGFGAGDISAGGRAILVRTRRDVFNLGLRAGLTLPTGRQSAYMAELGVRGSVGLLAATNLGPLRIATDLGVIGRGRLATEEDFVLGNELTWGTGARLALPDATRVAFTGQLLTRSGLERFLQGGAESGAELLGGIQVLPSRSVTLDVAAGRGLNNGVGTTDFRLLTALVIEHVPKEPVAKPPPPDWTPPPPPPPPLPPVVDEPEPEPEWEEGQLARIILDKIEIREMLEFRVDTNLLLDKSVPTLRAVAGIINGDARIGHVVIEGHASQEGPYDHNYTLSESRARAVFEHLFKEGVHPSRLSYRGMGEVVPLIEGEEEEILQQNRRVEFHIVRQFDDVADMPDYAPSARLPWNGAEVTIVQPEKPEVEEPEPEDEGPLLDEFGLPIDPDDAFEMQQDEAPTPEEAPGDDAGDEGPPAEEEE